jgi:uncharacterized protein
MDTGRASNAEKQPTGRGPEGCVENGPAAVPRTRDRYRSIQICALCRQSGSDRLAGPFLTQRCHHYMRDGTLDSATANDRSSKSRWSKRIRFSAAEARRIVLTALGFGSPRPQSPSRRHFKSLLERTSLVQIDSVNVLVRAHYMPFFSRLGPYPMKWLDEAAYHPRKRSLFEYWGHEASLIRLDLLPYFGWRMRRSSTGEGVWRSIRDTGNEMPELLHRIEAEIRKHGPMSAGELEKALSTGRRTASWWGWSECKKAVEWLFWIGRLTTASRRNFERIYGLTEQVFPDFRPEQVPEEEAYRMLVRVAAKALGIATAGDLRDYFRLAPKPTERGIEELVAAGELVPVKVDGWAQVAYLDPKARLPRQFDGRALVSPFDPLLWDRKRAERFFGLRYRIEIYTPAHKREHGYYVLPFLLGDTFAARLDLKADRSAGALQVLAAHHEDGIEPKMIVEPLGAELADLKRWLNLDRVVVHKRGNLAALLARHGRVKSAP